MAALCGKLGLVTSRDAFITAICKGSLPPHYALTVLNTTTAALSSKCKERFIFTPLNAGMPIISKQLSGRQNILLFQI